MRARTRGLGWLLIAGCGRVAFAPVADGQIDGAADDVDDVDDDGVRDDGDNCPTLANTDQHDEDADQLGDPCDPCPHLAGDAADADGDGVGDACDPRATASDRLAFFDPFTSPRPEWQLVSGLTVADDRLRASASGSQEAFARLYVSTGELRVDVAGTITSVDSQLPHQLSIAFGIDQTGNYFHYGQFYDSGGGGSINIMKAEAGTYTSLAAHTYPTVLPAGAWRMRIDESVAGQQITLEAELGGAAYAPLSASSATSTPLAAGSIVTLLVRNATVTFDHVVLIDSSP